MRPLNTSNLNAIKGLVNVPVYNRSLVNGIVHIGVGGFHRSHQAYMMHQLIAKNAPCEWGICGVGLREADRKMHTILKDQDYLYSLITRHPNGGVENEIIGSITDFILAVDAPEKLIDQLASIHTKIVSLTITEGGYNFNPASGAFDFSNQDIQHDLKHPKHPKSVFGYLMAALKRRMESGMKSFTILSCDNIQHNGEVARKMFLSFAKRLDENLYEWVKENTCFPNTMVDRITPVTTQEDIDYIQKEFDYVDRWPVSCEPFIQWVVEDQFSDGRPDLQQVGVQFVADVKPYEKMKLRLLNAGHSVLGIPGAIHGHPTINACMEDEVFSKFMRGFMDLEATPTLDPVEGIDLTAYKNSLEERFSNPNIKDSVARICSESSAKLPTFLFETIEDNLRNGGSIQYSALIVAAWCYYSDRQKDRFGNPLELIDDLKEVLHQYASNTSSDVYSFLKLRSLFGSLVENETFTSAYQTYVEELYRTKDVRTMMSTLLNESPLMKS